MSFLGEIIGNLVGAGVGAFLGYQLGVRQEKKSRIEREESRIKTMIKSILQECYYNSDVAGDKAVIAFWSSIERASVEDKEILTHDDLWINELSTAVLEM